MNHSTLIFGFLAGVRSLVIFGILLLATTTPSLAQCVPVGASPNCAVVITINPDGSLSRQVKSTQPYDGSDDSLVGVVNKSGATVFGILLTGNDIFGFDGDGLCTYIACTWPHPTGYEGPNMSFSPINANKGLVNFTGAGLADGASTFFSLEEAPVATSLSASVTIDPGHGHSCPPSNNGLAGQHQGTTGGGLSEDDLTVAVASSLRPLLVNAGYDVTMTKTDAASCPTLLRRAEIANHARSNIFLSIHFDKPARSVLGVFIQFHGSEGLYNAAKSSAGQLAAFLSARVSSQLGLSDRGALADETNVLKPSPYTEMTASIIEVGRLSGPDLTAILTPGSAGKAAAGIKSALDAFIQQ